MTDVFVALGNVDLERVNRILTVLRMRGYRVWVPQNTERKALTDERAHALRKAKCGVALWSSSSPASKSVPIFANYANEKGILINVPLDDAKIPPELDAHEALDLSDWHSNEEDGFRRLEERIRPFTRPSPEKFSLGAALVELAARAAQKQGLEQLERARNIAPPVPASSTVLPGLPAYGATTMEELIKIEARLRWMGRVLLGLFVLIALGAPLADLTVGRAIGLSERRVIFWLVGRAAPAFLFRAIYELLDHRRECAREVLVFERSKSDPRPFCLLLRYPRRSSARRGTNRK